MAEWLQGLGNSSNQRKMGGKNIPDWEAAKGQGRARAGAHTYTGACARTHTGTCTHTPEGLELLLAAPRETTPPPCSS